MHFKKILFFIILVSFKLTAQYSNDTNNRLNITISPLSLINGYEGFPLRMGIEYNLNHKIMISLDGETPVFNTNQSVKMNPKGFVIKPSLNFKAYDSGSESGYLGIEYMYKNQDYRFRDSININEIKFDKFYKMNRKVHTVSVKAIFREEISNHFYYDVDFGLGIRLINSTSNLSAEEQNGVYGGEFEGVTQSEDLIRRVGKLVYPNLLFNIKVGYRIF